jgi:hypothetical protein
MRIIGEMKRKRSDEGKSFAYLALTMSSFESVLVDEIKRKLSPGEAPAGTGNWIVALDSTNSVLGTGNQPTAAAPGQAGVGKVLFYTRSPAADVLKLQAAQGLYALLVSGVDDLAKDKSELERIKVLLEEAEWEDALTLWRIHRQHSPQHFFQESGGSPSMRTFFRASCVRDGKHDFTSTDVSGKVGAAVLQKMGAFDEQSVQKAAKVAESSVGGGAAVGTSASDWSVRLDEFHIEVVTIILQRSLVSGIYLPSSSSLDTPHTLLVAGEKPAEDAVVTQADPPTDTKTESKEQEAADESKEQGAADESKEAAGEGDADGEGNKKK